MGFRSGLPQPHSSIYLIPLWLAILKRPSRIPGTACRAGTIATPPKSGGACGPKPKASFRPYQTPEPQPWGAVTRRAVAQRRSRVAA